MNLDCCVYSFVNVVDVTRDVTGASFRDRDPALADGLSDPLNSVKSTEFSGSLK